MVSDTQQLWQNALGELQIQMRPEDFRTWFRNTSLLSYEGSTCVVGVENPFSVDWLTTKCSGMVSRTLQSLTGQPIEVKFTVGRVDDPPGAAVAPMLTLSAPEPAKLRARAPRRAPIEPVL